MLDKLIDLLKDCWGFFKFVQVLEPYEQAVVTRLGSHARTVGPGMRWNWPCAVERVHRYPVNLDTQELDKQTLTSADGVAVTVIPIVTFAISDIEQIVLHFQGEKEALTDSAAGVIGELMTTTNWRDQVTPEFWNKATIKVRARARRYGIAVESVTFKSLVRTRAWDIFLGR